jgi:hypothetical protein
MHQYAGVDEEDAAAFATDVQSLKATTGFFLRKTYPKQQKKKGKMHRAKKGPRLAKRKLVKYPRLHKLFLPLCRRCSPQRVGRMIL